ncbi:MAG: hypothetical protein M3406_12060 [Chloroflexota bacterium]|nr:hypothetical protein [Chloroflexota bacterium]
MNDFDDWTEEVRSYVRSRMPGDLPPQFVEDVMHDVNRTSQRGRGWMGWPMLGGLATVAGAIAVVAISLSVIGDNQFGSDATPTASASASPSASAVPSADETLVPEPSISPDAAASPPEVVAFELPMAARTTTDSVEVRDAPSADAPLVSGERYSDPATVPNVELAAGEPVLSTLGPVFADGESWYQVTAASDGGEWLNWGAGWVPARVLAREGQAEGYAPIVSAHGVGSGTMVAGEVRIGTPITLDYAATPVADRDACELTITIVGTDGATIYSVTESVTGAIVQQVTRDDEPSLFQEEAGSVTLEVVTDCSYAATIFLP